MTIEAAEGSEPEPGPVTCGQVRARLDGLAGEYAALMAALAADRDRPDLARRVTALTVAFREARAQLAGHVFADAINAEKTATAAAVPGRHAAPSRRAADVIPLRPRPRRGAVHGLAPAAVLLAGHGTRHVLTAHLKLGLTAAAAASVAAAGVTYTIQTQPDQHPASLPAMSAPAAAPAAVADPAGPRLVRKHHHRHARPATRPLATPTAAPPRTPPPPPAPAPGVLNIQQATVTLTQTAPGQYTGQLTLYATGGPARWRVDWLGTDSAIQVDQDSGVITAGQQATITVTVDAALVSPGQSWTLTLDDGQQVTVTAAG